MQLSMALSEILETYIRTHPLTVEYLGDLRVDAFRPRKS